VNNVYVLDLVTITALAVVEPYLLAGRVIPISTFIWKPVYQASDTRFSVMVMVKT